MHPIYNWHFSLGLLTYSINKLLPKHDIEIHPLLSNHLSDFLAMPILLSLSMFSIRFIVSKLHNFIFSPWQLIFTFIYASIVFEWAAPQIFEGKTSDWLDVLAYGLGTIYFMLFMNRKP
jgi:hypothetical protein